MHDDDSGDDVEHARSRIWRAIVSNPALPIAAYLALVGIAATVDGGLRPNTLQALLPSWLVWSWTLALAAGGVLAVVGCLARRTRLESGGLGLLVFGTGLYGFVFAFVAGGIGLTAAVAVLALTSTCLIRMRILHDARRAHEEAQRIVTEDEQ